MEDEGVLLLSVAKFSSKATGGALTGQIAWANVAAALDGRTVAAVKNRFYSISRVARISPPDSLPLLGDPIPAYWGIFVGEADLVRRFYSPLRLRQALKQQAVAQGVAFQDVLLPDSELAFKQAVDADVQSAMHDDRNFFNAVRHTNHGVNKVMAAVAGVWGTTAFQKIGDRLRRVVLTKYDPSGRIALLLRFDEQQRLLWHNWEVADEGVEFRYESAGELSAAAVVPARES